MNEPFAGGGAPMTEERLAEWREFRDIVREEQAAGLHAYDRDYEFAEAVDEIDRLRALAERREAVAVDQERAAVGANLIASMAAENERLRADNERLEMKLADRVDRLGFKQSDYERMRANATALNPEPTS